MIKAWRSVSCVTFLACAALAAEACSGSGGGSSPGDDGGPDSTADDSSTGEAGGGSDGPAAQGEAATDAAAMAEAGDDSTSDAPGAETALNDAAPSDAATDTAATTDADASGTGDADAMVVFDAPADVVDSGPPGPPHRIFVTSRSYTGDLVSAANALIGDAEIPATDGGAFGATQGRQAADALCQYNATAAGLSGTFKAIIYSGGTSTFTGVTDADGPWALVDGTPVAQTVADLKAGSLHASVDVTELGTPHPFGNAGSAYQWEGQSYGGYDCEQWTSAAATIDGGANQGLVGQYRTIYPWLGGAVQGCNQTAPLHCLQVGAGGGANVYPVPAAGSKLVFVAPGPFTGNFVAAADGGVPDAGTDAVHARADQLCAAAATTGGLSGTFRAYISSSTTTASAYFSAHSMNGPWVRPDGFPVAANLAALTGAGPLQSQIALYPNGTFVTGFAVAWTGTTAAGALGGNCTDFTSASASAIANEAYVIWKDFSSMYGTTYCNQNAKLLCFQQ